MKPILKVENLSHIYSAGTPFEHGAVDHVNLEVMPGEFLGIIGHTGSGKSTLIQHLNGLLRPTDGQILLDGQDIWSDKKLTRQARFRVGLVFQYPEYQLFEETVNRDVAFGPKNLGLSEAECTERVSEALARVKLSQAEIGERSPLELSGGQMRRVAIAGVLAMRPSTLVLDEPAAGLDPAGRRDMLELVSTLHKEGTTIVMVSHSMEDVANYATHIAVLEHGALALEGAPREVFAHGARLAKIGLDVPVTVRIADMLREKGYALPEGVCRMEELRGWLLEHLERGTGLK